jgi:hypothetical protein
MLLLRLSAAEADCCWRCCLLLRRSTVIGISIVEVEASAKGIVAARLGGVVKAAIVVAGCCCWLLLLAV